MAEEIKEVVKVLSALLIRIESLEFKLEALDDRVDELESLYMMDGPTYDPEL